MPQNNPMSVIETVKAICGCFENQSVKVFAIEDIIKARDAQLQIGREERQHEVDLAELEADRVKIEWEHDLERYAALEEAAREARAWIDGILCQCDTTVDHVCDRCVLIRSIDKALSALDEAKGESR
jgi:regulator of protease activity HflC (stomatin/prohibitin superfamily)